MNQIPCDIQAREIFLESVSAGLAARQQYNMTLEQGGGFFSKFAAQNKVSPM